MKPRWKKGMVLLQTLVMSVLLSLIAVMVMKWVLARYMMAARNYRATTSTARATGYSQQFFSTWNSGAAPACGANVDGQNITCSIAPPNAGMQIVTMTVDEDQ